MGLMDFLLDYGDLSTNVVREESDVWEQFGVDIAPLVIDSVGFTRTTQAEGIVHFLTQLAKARRVTEQVLGQLNPISFVFMQIIALLFLILLTPLCMRESRLGALLTAPRCL